MSGLWQNRKLRIGVIIAALLLLVGGLKACLLLSEVGLEGVLPGRQAPRQSQVLLTEQPVYKIKRKQEILGIHVTRIISRQQPEEFLVLEYVPAKLVGSVYGRGIDLAWANSIAGQLLRLRQSGEDGPPASLEIQDVHTVGQGTLPNGLPYWQIEIRFKLANESAPRYYQAVVVRNINADKVQETAKFETLVVGYAPKEAFDKALVSDLLHHVRFGKAGV